MGWDSAEYVIGYVDNEEDAIKVVQHLNKDLHVDSPVVHDYRKIEKIELL